MLKCNPYKSVCFSLCIILRHAVTPVSLQGVHQPGDPGGHRDQTQPSLPDQRRGPNPSSGLCRHGDRIRRGGASGLQLQKGRGFIRLRAGTVVSGVNQGGAPGRDPGSAGEHPQRPWDVGHTIRRHRGADVGRLWLAPSQKLPPGGGPAAPAPCLPSPEPPHRRPSLSPGRQRHPLRLRDDSLSGLHKNESPTFTFELSLSSSLSFCRHFSFAAFATLGHVFTTDRVHFLSSVCLIDLPVNLLTE